MGMNDHHTKVIQDYKARNEEAQQRIRLSKLMIRSAMESNERVVISNQFMEALKEKYKF